MTSNNTDISISSIRTTVEQDQGRDPQTGLRHRRMTEIVTDGDQLLEISNRLWDELSHDDQVKFNQWVERYHYLLVDIAAERLEIRERIEAIIAAAPEQDDLDMIRAAIATAQAEWAEQVAA